MKLFFWQLNDKEKLHRVFWTGLLVLTLLYAGVWYKGFNWIVPFLLTALYIADVSIRYQKVKRGKAYEGM